MGRRSDDAQGRWRALALEKVGQVGEPLADRFRNLPDSRLVRIMPSSPRANHSFQTCSSSADHPLRPGIEASANRRRISSRDFIVPS